MSIAIGQDTVVQNNCGITIGNCSTNNGWGVTIGCNAIAFNDAVAIGYQANSDSYGLAIGNNAQADYGNITLKSGNVEVKFTRNGMTLNGEPYGGGSGSGSDRKQEMLYKIKYAHTELYEVRYSQTSEWRDYYDEYGNYITGYTWYPYYDDITAKGEWYYDLKTKPNVFTWSSDYTWLSQNQFESCPLLKKFAAKIGNDITKTVVSNLFTQCDYLEEVIIDCTWLRDVSNLFSYCPKVHTFYADLSKLESAGYMFGSDAYNCTSLNVESVEHIANSIGQNYSEIHIGMARELQWDNGDGKYSRCQEALNKIRSKGWTVYEIYSENY